MGLFKSKAERWFEEGKNLIYKQEDVNQGIVLLEKSAEREFAPAMLMLAELYHSGQVRDGGRYSRQHKARTCPQNEARALELYQKLPDCLPVFARKAEIYCCDDDEVRDDAKALQMFREIQSRAGEKENGRLFDLLGIMRLWRDDISGETLAIDAGAYIAVMRFWGRGGLEEDTEQEYNALKLYVRTHEKTDDIDGDFYFCYAALEYRREGQLSIKELENLLHIYRETANMEIRRILKEEMLPSSLKEMFNYSIRQGKLSRAKDGMSMMMVICEGDEELRAQLGEFLFEILQKETDRFATTEDYEMLLSLLEQCSTDFDSIRMSCHLIDFYLTHTITRTRTRDGEVQEVKTIKFEDSACKVMSRICEQLERLQKSETDLKEKFDLAFCVKRTLYIYDLKLKNIAPDDFKNMYRLSNMIQDEWQDYINQGE